MATLDSFREAAGEPIQLDLANGYIADIRLNAGDINDATDRFIESLTQTNDGKDHD